MSKYWVDRDRVRSLGRMESFNEIEGKACRGCTGYGECGSKDEKVCISYREREGIGMGSDDVNSSFNGGRG